MAAAPAGPFKPAPGVVARDMGHAAVVVHLDSNRIFELNPTGARVWALIEAGRSVPEICAQLKLDYPDAGDVDSTVAALMADFTREGLIVA